MDCMQVPPCCPVCMDDQLKPVKSGRLASSLNAKVIAYRCSKGHTFTVRTAELEAEGVEPEGAKGSQSGR